MEAQISKEKLLNEWARITIERLQKRIKKFKIGNSNALHDSLRYEIVSATGGDKEKIILLYKLYGMFVDMGVGNGVNNTNKREHKAERSLGSSSYKGKTRKAKKWYSPTMFAEVIALADLLMENYGINATFTVTENIDTNIKMNL